MNWGISPTSVGRLQEAGAPFGLLVVIAYLHALCGPICRTADLVELFSGMGHLSAEFRARGMHAMTYDVSDDPDLEDMTSIIGMVHAILLVLQPRMSLLHVRNLLELLVLICLWPGANACKVLRLKQHGLVWAGVPCSSFVWLNRSTSGRSKDMDGFMSALRVCMQVGNTRWALSEEMFLSETCKTLVPGCPAGAGTCSWGTCWEPLRQQDLLARPALLGQRWLLGVRAAWQLHHVAPPQVGLSIQPQPLAQNTYDQNH
jgi:hypothetical protein